MTRSSNVARFAALAALTLLCLFASVAPKSSAADAPSFGPIQVKRGHYVGFPRVTFKVRVAEAGRVVIWLKGRRHEASEGKTADCGSRSCRWWYVDLIGLGRDPLPAGYIGYLIRATNESGSEKIIGDRCRHSLWCHPYRVLCSTLNSEGWLETEADKFRSPRRQVYARDIQRCGTLLRMNRSNVEEFMGTPDREGRTWASWETGANMLGDIQTIEVTFRLGRVVKVSGAH